MREERREVRTFMVRAYCGECGEELKHTGPGEMALYNMLFNGNPPTYKHECKNGHTEELTNTFPRLEYKEKVSE